MHRLLARALALFSLLLLFAACGVSYKPFVLESKLPTRGEVEALEAEPVPEVTIAPEGVSVERWALAGPFPDVLGLQPRRPSSPLEEVAAGFTGGATFSEQMACASRELGRFFLRHGDWPEPRIERFVLKRCGSLSRVTHGEYFTWRLPLDGVPRDEAVLVKEAFSELSRISSELGARERGGELGAWFGHHEDGRAFAFFFVGFPKVELEPTPLVPRGDSFVLQGRVLERAYDAQISITTGAYRSVYCTKDDRVELPRFAFRCPNVGGDAVANLDMSIQRRPDSQAYWRIFLPSVWPAGRLPDAYVSTRHHQLTTRMEVDGQIGGAGYSEEFVSMVNALRAEHGLPNLLHSEAQTRTVQRLTPRLHSVSGGGGEDEVLAAARAGWGIADAPIVSTHYYAGTVAVDDPRGFVSMLADDATGRRILFGEGEGALAIGAIPQGEVAYVFVCSYAFLPDMTHRERIAELQRVINAKRKLAGKGKMRRYKNFYALADELAADVTAGRRDPNEAAKILGVEVRKTLNKGVYWYTMYQSSLGHFTLPEDLLESDPLHGAILVAPFRAEGQRHTRYFIVIAYPMEHSATR